MSASLRRPQLFLTGFFLALILGVPLTQAGVEIYRGRWPQCFDIFSRPPVEKNLRSFEGELERVSVVSQALRPRIQYGWFTLGNPGYKAVIGKDGWLFYRPDVRYLLEPIEEGADPLPTILIQFMTPPESAGHRPVCNIARYGVHNGHVDSAFVKFMPWLAKRSIFGVGIFFPPL